MLSNLNVKYNLVKILYNVTLAGQTRLMFAADLDLKVGLLFEGTIKVSRDWLYPIPRTLEQKGDVFKDV